MGTPLGILNAHNFAYVVVGIVGLIILVFSLLIELFAFVHCALQRGDAFPAVGTLSKGIWLLIIGGCIVLSFLLGSGGPLNLIGLIGLIAASVYVLDVRPAIRDATDGSGPW